MHETTYDIGTRIRCPHCVTVVQLIRPTSQSATSTRYHANGKQTVYLKFAACPSCYEVIVTLTIESEDSGNTTYLAYPFIVARPVPPEVPPNIANLYRESVSVLNLSPRASAALSRLCLEMILTEQGGKPGDDLKSLINSAPGLSATQQRMLHAVREVGNFGVHPRKSIATGEIFDVSSEDAALNLTVLERLFQVYYVEPAEDDAALNGINNNLTAAGKKTI